MNMSVYRFCRVIVLLMVVFLLIPEAVGAAQIVIQPDLFKPDKKSGQADSKSEGASFSDPVPAGNSSDLMKNLFANIDLSTQFANWSINSDSTSPVMQYRTEGLAMMKLSGNVGIGNKSLVTVSYERPFDDTARQRDMLAANGSSTHGMEKFVGGVKLDPVIDLLFPEKTLLHSITRKALSVRFKYTSEVYFAEATAGKNAIYLPSGAVFNHQARTVSGGEEIQSGHKLASKTALNEQEVSLPLMTFDMPYYLNGELLRMAEHDLRIGQYSRRWSRPSDTDVITIKDRSGTARPLVYDADYESEGIMIALETTDIDAPGFNADVSFRIGYHDRLTSAIEWEKITNRPVDTGFYAVNLSLWYNYYFNSKRYKGWCLSAGGSWTKSAMNVEMNGDSGGDTKTIVHDTDIFTKYFLTLSYRF